MNITSTPTSSTKLVELAKAERSVPGTARAPDKDEAQAPAAASVVAPKEPEEANPTEKAAEARELKARERAEASVTEKSVERAIEDVREFVQRNQRTLDFQVAEESNRVIITVIDRQTNEVIRQIPPEDLVRMAENMRDAGDVPPGGLLFKGTA